MLTKEELDQINRFSLPAIDLWRCCKSGIFLLCQIPCILKTAYSYKIIAFSPYRSRTVKISHDPQGCFFFLHQALCIL